MVAPVTGPFSTTVVMENWKGNGSTTVRSRKTAKWYRQARPFDRPLAYEMTRARLLDYAQCSTVGWASVSTGRASTFTFATPEVASVYNKAYSRLASQIKEDTAEWGAGLGELRKSAAMVEDRCVQLWQFTRALRRGRFGDAAHILGVKQPRRLSGLRARSRGFAGTYLEYSFGWAPLVGDIYSGMKILCNGVPPLWAKASAGGIIPASESVVGSHPTISRRQVLGGNVRVTAGCSVTLTNPNLWLANQLGLINPVGVAWELVPFSFVVDYFINVGDVINSWSEFMGLGISRPYRSFVVETTYRQYDEFGLVSTSNTPCSGSTGGEIPNVSWNRRTEYSVKMLRELNLPGPSLRFAAPRVSLRRASTSIALLLQQLKGK